MSCGRDFGHEGTESATTAIRQRQHRRTDHGGNYQPPAHPENGARHAPPNPCDQPDLRPLVRPGRPAHDEPAVHARHARWHDRDRLPRGAAPSRSGRRTTREPRRGPRRGVWQAVRSHRLGFPFLRELLLMAGVFFAYRQIRFLTRGDTEVALDRGRAVMGLEQHLHVAAERAVQRAAMLGQMAIIHVLDRYYVFMHFTVTTAFLVWVFARRPEAYARIRAWFVGVTRPPWPSTYRPTRWHRPGC